MYKSGGGVDITIDDFRYVEVTDDSGKTVSDHSSAECDFTFIKTSDFVENTGKLEVVEAPANNFLSRLLWFFKALIMILSDIQNLPALFE